MGIGVRRGNVGTAAAIAVAMMAAVAVGATVTAQLAGDGEGVDEPASPGTPVAGRDAGDATPSERITTGGSNFDPTILTTFIPGTSFIPYQGGSIEADLVRYESPDSTCVSADANGGGVLAEFRRGVELPDGARIKRVTFFGQDSDAIYDIGIRLSKGTVQVPGGGGSPTKSFTVIDSFDTFGFTGVVAISGADNLQETVGSSGDDHVFPTLHVQLRNSAAANHKLCGVEVEYQVPVQSPEGTVFHPVSPYRAYDSRFEMAPVADGPLAAGPGRVIPVKDGRNVNTGAIDLPNAIPASATAIAYTVTAASPTGSGFLFVGPGGAPGITASSLNWDDNTSGAIANSSIVQLDAARRVKVFAGGSPGASTGFIIDVTGYFGPPVHPNMGN